MYDRVITIVPSTIRELKRTSFRIDHGRQTAEESELPAAQCALSESEVEDRTTGSNRDVLLASAEISNSARDNRAAGIGAPKLLARHVVQREELAFIITAENEPPGCGENTALRRAVQLEIPLLLACFGIERPNCAPASIVGHSLRDTP